MLLSIKTKLKLNSDQKVLMAKHAGIARFTYNWGLATWNDFYKSGLKPNKIVLRTFFNKQVKPELPWIKEKGICQKITQYAFDNLEKAFINFFKGLKKHPKFKKKGVHDSFTIDLGGLPMSVGGTSIKLPTIGWLKTYEGLPHTTCKKVTISRIAEEWFIAFTYEQKTKPSLKTHKVVGVDLGIKELATLSTGEVFSNPKHYKNNLKKLKKLSQNLAKKVKGSSNRYKARMKLAKQHAKVANLRKDTLHKLTTFLCKNHAETIVIEDLAVANMLKNHKLAQAIQDCGWGEFRRQLGYKSIKFGNEIIVVDKFFASSKTCSNCGCIKETLTLKERIYNCEHCGSTLDRDLNAAINLSRLAEA